MITTAQLIGAAFIAIIVVALVAIEPWRIVGHIRRKRAKNKALNVRELELAGAQDTMRREREIGYLLEMREYEKQEADAYEVVALTMIIEELMREWDRMKPEELAQLRYAEWMARRIIGARK